MGSCFDVANKEMFLIMECMQQGSLYDVLHNPQVRIVFCLFYFIIVFFFFLFFLERKQKGRGEEERGGGGGGGGGGTGR
jgi:hypothetical protein